MKSLFDRHRAHQGVFLRGGEAKREAAGVALLGAEIREELHLRSDRTERRLALIAKIVYADAIFAGLGAVQHELLRAVPGGAIERDARWNGAIGAMGRYATFFVADFAAPCVPA